MPYAESEEKNFLDYVDILRRRKLMIIVIVIVAVVLALAIDRVRPKVYGATASMQLVSQNVSLQTGTIDLTPTDIATDIQLVQSAAVKAIVAASLDQPAPKATVTEVASTEVLDVHVSGSDAAFAARAANEYVSAYIKFTTDRYAKQTQQQETILQTERTTLQSEITQIETQIATNSATNASNVALNTQLDSYVAQLDAVVASLSQLQLDQTQVPSGALTVSPVPPNTSPISPKPLTDGVIAGFLGLIVGIGLALTLDVLDDRIRTKEQLRAVSGKLPLLGEIPYFENWKDQPADAVIATVRPKSAAAEAYRSLRTAIQFIGFDSDRAPVIQITSPMESEGKTTTVIDLAFTMASSGTRVVVVSCDLRKPGIHKFFKTDNSKGLSSVLGGTETLESVVVASEVVPNLICIPSGPIPPNPSELLGSTRLADIFESLRSVADVILVDSPPVLPVTDAIVVAQVVDIVVLLSRENVTHARGIARALELLSNVDAPVKGVVLNAVTAQSSGGRYGRYGEYGRYGRYGGYGGYGS